MKQIDWNANYRSPIRGKRDPKGQYNSAKELFQKAHARRSQQEAAVRSYEALEPLLKQRLLEYMVGRKPIRVTKSFKYLTEELQKSEYGAGQYVNVTKDIPAGTVLTFQKINKSLKQWLFTADDGSEIEIYDAPVVMFDKSVVKNPAWYGLLLNTNIFEEVSASLHENNEE